MGSLQTVPCNITHTIYVPLHVHLVLGDNHSNCFLSDPSDFPGSRLLPELSPDNRFNMPKSQFTILFSKTLLLLVNFRHPPLRHPSGKSGSYPRLLLTPASPMSEVPTMPFLCCTEIRSSIPMPLLLLPFLGSFEEAHSCEMLWHAACLYLAVLHFWGCREQSPPLTYFYLANMFSSLEAQAEHLLLHGVLSECSLNPGCVSEM